MIEDKGKAAVASDGGVSEGDEAFDIILQKCLMGRRRVGMYEVLLLSKTEERARAETYRREEWEFYKTYAESDKGALRSKQRLDSYEEELEEIDREVEKLTVQWRAAVEDFERLKREYDEAEERSILKVPSEEKLKEAVALCVKPVLATSEKCG